MRGCSTILWALWLAGGGMAAGSGKGTEGNEFEFERGGRHVTVRYYAPAAVGRDAPVIFVMHGVKRNGEDYLRTWMPLARENGFLLVVPEFSLDEFPGDEGYNYGNTVDAAGHPRPRDQWSFTMIEPIFDAVQARTGNRCSRYSLYGHSAGAQFVQRLLYFSPTARLDRAVAANAGWYMLPSLVDDFPYGLRGTAVSVADRDTALTQPLTILLGTDDNDPHHRVLRHTPEAEAQGPHRFARGQFFFHYARELAAREGLEFAWSVATAPSVAHSDKGMAPFALKILLPR